jgi:hypothetical protein
MTDRPIVTENLLGGDEGINDAGFSLARIRPRQAAVPGQPRKSSARFRDVFVQSTQRRQPVGHLHLQRPHRSTSLDLGYPTPADTTTSAAPTKLSCTTSTHLPLDSAPHHLQNFVARAEFV